MTYLRQSNFFALLAPSLLALTMGCGDDVDDAGATAANGGASQGGAATATTGNPSSGGANATSTSSTGTGGAGGNAETISLIDKTGAPTPDIDVVAHDAAGVIVDEAKTDSQGVATVNAPPGGSITILHTASIGGTIDRRITTLFGVPDGATLQRTIDLGSPPPPSMGVNVSAASLPSGTSKVVLLPSCSNNVNEEVLVGDLPGLVFASSCDATTVDLVVLAKNNSDVVLGYHLATAIPFQNGGSYNVDLTGSDFVTTVPQMPLSWTGGGLLALRVASLSPLDATDNELLNFFRSNIGQANNYDDSLGFAPVPSSLWRASELSVKLSANVTKTYGAARIRLLADPTALPAWDIGGIRHFNTMSAPDTAVEVSWGTESSGTLGMAINALLRWSTAGGEERTWTGFVASAPQGMMAMPTLPAAYSEWELASGEAFSTAIITHIVAPTVTSASDYFEGANSVDADLAIATWLPM